MSDIRNLPPTQTKVPGVADNQQGAAQNMLSVLRKAAGDDGKLSVGEFLKNHKDIKAAQQDLKDVGMSDSEQKAMLGNVANEDASKKLAAHLDAGGTPDDKISKSYLNNAFFIWCRQNGRPLNKDDSKRDFAQAVAPALARAGVQAAHIQQMLDHTSKGEVKLSDFLSNRV